MSFFYLKPIEGRIQLHDLQKCILQRFEYIQTLVRGENPSTFSEYMIEGSPYDNIGHFSIILMTVLSGNPKLADTVIKGEQYLFNRRLKLCQRDALRHLCKSILKDLMKDRLDIPDLLHIPLRIVCQKLILKHLAQHVVNHSSECSSYSIKLHFTHCLRLVAKREVEVFNGEAVVTCDKWITFLTHLFQSHLKFKAKVKPTSETDPRWKEIISLLNDKIKNTSVDNQLLSHSEIDGQSNTFPPCMSQLHQNLRTEHRLPHNRRFLYSLFLKDIGLPLQESIHFWQFEYSKPHERSICVHSWIESGKKYVYGIRHLYGLEGSRRNYSTPGCAQLQANSTDCVCAFKSFRRNNFNNLSEKVLNEISDNVAKKQFSKACGLYRNAILNNLENRSDQIYSPVDYYVSFKSIS